MFNFLAILGFPRRKDFRDQLQSLMGLTAESISNAQTYCRQSFEVLRKVSAVTINDEQRSAINEVENRLKRLTENLQQKAIEIESIRNELERL